MEKTPATITQRQFDNHNTILILSQKYNLPYLTSKLLYDDDYQEYGIGMLWYNDDILMDIEIYDEDETTFCFMMKDAENPKIAEFSKADNCEVLFKELKEKLGV